MHPMNDVVEYQLQHAIARREAQIQRSMLRQYLAETSNEPSFQFRLRKGASSALLVVAGAIGPRPKTAVTEELWVPELHNAS